MNNKTKVVIAVDPGVSGGIAVFSRSEISTYALEKTDPRELFRNLANGAGCDSYQLVAYMEKVGGYIPTKEGEGQPGSRMFVFGEAYGYMRGLMDGYHIPFKLVLPQVWQRGIPGRRGEYSSRKKALHAHAKRLFPNLTFTKAEADALGILHYALFAEGISNTGYSAPLAALPDDSAAVAWCRSQGYDVPSYGSKAYAAMVRYYAEEVA